MGNLKEIRTRISSVTSTRKITSAMKMVSASKFKKAQDVLIKYKPFYDHYRSSLEFVIANNGNCNNKYCEIRKDISNIGLVVISSNGSMCGSFNQNVIKKTAEAHYQLSIKYPKAKIHIFCIGKKATDILSKKGLEVKPLSSAAVDKPNILLTKKIFEELSELFLKRDLDMVEFVFNSFKNAAVQIQTISGFLPYALETKDNSSNADIIIEPNPEIFIQKTLPKFLLYKIHAAILESTTAEHGARMTAMHQATDNATDLLKDLTLQYNKERQAAITKEILEIVSGANALKG
ncbi:MAG: ATP synthase F1 subunit gamma [Bacteroidales bacterium]|nr:ATP synthase F1 subunit gamma [Bacteroidales bacterium]